jgi:putative membrane-bound dehydrogenase-like protein
MRPLHGLSILVLLVTVVGSNAAPPVPTDHRLVMELVAKEPDIVTPTGIAVDDQGRVWVIENNTHQRTKDYKGPAGDRIRVFSDFDTSGHAKRITTFAGGFRDSMALAIRPLTYKERYEDGKLGGDVYLATRSAIHVLRDAVMLQERKVIVRLETAARYPHNGLSALVFDELGDLYFGMGENEGLPYKLIGSDGSMCTGGGEGGGIYRCRPDGGKLVRIATGFWNPFGLGFDAFGRLFAVDNDPDSRGPCRLLHIVEGGDYGYRYRNGRKGLHPFTAWNGELPGTLPMVAGTGEAPCAVLAYEWTGLPSEYYGNLLVTSWGDHLIERFQLRPRGASLTSQSQTLVQGGEDFRPVGMVAARDGSLYISDWVDKSYPVHGKGRIWRLRMKQSLHEENPPKKNPKQDWAAGTAKQLGDPRRDVRSATAAKFTWLDDTPDIQISMVLERNPNLRARMHLLWAAERRRRETAVKKDLLRPFLSDTAPEVRSEAVRFLGESLSETKGARDEGALLDFATKDASAAVRRQAILELHAKTSLEAIVPRLADDDPFLASAALTALGRPGNTALLLAHAGEANPRIRVGVLLALRQAGEADGKKALPQWLADPDPGVRRAAIQWVGEERLKELTPLLKTAVEREPMTRDVLEAYLATNALLAGEKRKPGDEIGGEDYVAKVVRDGDQPGALRALAMEMLRPDHPALSARFLKEFLASSDERMRWPALRTLVMRSDEASQDMLRKLALDPDADLAMRAEAVMGLAQSAPASSATRRVLLTLLKETQLQSDVLRSLRETAGKPGVETALMKWWQETATPPVGHVADRQEIYQQLSFTLRPDKNSETGKRLQALLRARPQNATQWRAALTEKGNPRAGERVFFHPRGPRCYVCHRVDGRGAAIGPDLSTIGRSLSRDKLIDSILEPSKEIAPQFVSWLIATRDGKVRTGLIVEEGPNSTITIADTQGNLEVIHRTAVEERHAVTTSIMPASLPELMTRREFVDLLAFLRERK